MSFLMCPPDWFGPNTEWMQKEEAFRKTLADLEEQGLVRKIARSRAQLMKGPHTVVKTEAVLRHDGYPLAEMSYRVQNKKGKDFEFSARQICNVRGCVTIGHVGNNGATSERPGPLYREVGTYIVTSREAEREIQQGVFVELSLAQQADAIRRSMAREDDYLPPGRVRLNVLEEIAEPPASSSSSGSTSTSSSSS